MNMAEEEELIVADEEKITVPSEFMELAEKNRRVIKGNSCPGCGTVLGLKMALTVLPNCVVVWSGHVTDALSGRLFVPAVMARNAASVASGVARAGMPVMVYADDVSTNRNLQSVLNAAKRDENIIYICYNYHEEKRSFARLFRNSCAASISHMEDYIRKLNKASSGGFRFIELLAPCPKHWGFDASNTVEVARLGVETNTFPLYEIEESLRLTHIPTRAEAMERYTELQKRYKNIKQEEREKLKVAAEKNWKSLKK